MTADPVPPDQVAEPLLFSIDVEEFYPADPGRNPRSTPLPTLVGRYLELLARHEVHATFFVVGEAARRYPEVVASIVAAGHEVGCHGDRHLPLDRFSKHSFAVDVCANRAAVQAVTGAEVRGFRAPILSLTQDTAWAHDVLAAEGFAYSSSVLPAASPLYGWPDFNAKARSTRIVELPITVVSPLRLGPLPAFCGTYFRVLPWWLLRPEIQRLSAADPLVCYFHPYDIDTGQPWVMHAGVRGSRWMNALLFVRRRSLLNRLDRLLASGRTSLTYDEYATRLSTKSPSPSSPTGRSE